MYCAALDRPNFYDARALYASHVVPVGREDIARIIRDHIEGDDEGYLSGVGAAADAILAALGMKGAE
jgi:hypothetical protein